MKQSEYNRYKELCENIAKVIEDGYDWTHDVYTVAVNPATYELVPVDEESQAPDGWIYEVLLDSEYSTIEECAKQYFDFRR